MGEEKTDQPTRCSGDRFMQWHFKFVVTEVHEGSMLTELLHHVRMAIARGEMQGGDSCDGGSEVGVSFDLKQPAHDGETAVRSC